MTLPDSSLALRLYQGQKEEKNEQERLDRRGRKPCRDHQGKAGHAVEAVLDHIKKSMKKGDEVRIPDFGTFKVAKRKAREGRNPATGATIKIPAAKVPKFTPSKGLKELLN